jgi:hypothetical protein
MSDTKTSLPSIPELVDRIKASGSSDERFFGYPPREGGLFLQQDPLEFAQFVHFMANQYGSADLTLDLGIASGGQTKFLRDFYKCKRTIILDNGEHSMFPHLKRIKPMVDTTFEDEIISDSHAPAVHERLVKYTNSLDFAFVDGDHSYRGLRQDIFLVTPLLKDYAVMALHDTAAVGDCKRVYDDLLNSRNFTRLRSFENRFGISLWMRLPRRKPQHWYNHRYGWGNI